MKLLAFFPSETGSGKHDIDKLELLGKAEVYELFELPHTLHYLTTSLGNQSFANSSCYELNLQLASSKTGTIDSDFCSDRRC